MTLISVTMIILKPTIPDDPAARIHTELKRDLRSTLRSAADACAQRNHPAEGRVPAGALGAGTGATPSAGTERGHRARALSPGAGPGQRSRARRWSTAKSSAAFQLALMVPPGSGQF